MNYVGAKKVVMLFLWWQIPLHARHVAQQSMPMLLPLAQLNANVHQGLCGRIILGASVRILMLFSSLSLRDVLFAMAQSILQGLRLIKEHVPAWEN